MHWHRIPNYGTKYWKRSLAKGGKEEPWNSEQHIWCPEILAPVMVYTGEHEWTRKQLQCKHWKQRDVTLYSMHALDGNQWSLSSAVEEAQQGRWQGQCKTMQATCFSICLSLFSCTSGKPVTAVLQQSTCERISDTARSYWLHWETDAYNTLEAEV